MEKQELTSKWDDLAREIGAEVPPETVRREEVISTVRTEASPPSQARQPAATISPPPKPSSADWDKLAADIGLPPAEATARAVEPSASPREEPRPARSPRATAPREESRTPELERPPREARQRPEQRPPREKRQESGRGGRDRPPPDKRREPRTPSASEAQRETKSTAETPPSPSHRPREEPAKPAAVSLWHKIFGSSSEQSAKFTDVSPGSRETEANLAAREEPETFSSGDEIRSLSGAEVTAAGFVDELDQNEDAEHTSEESTATQQKRGRVRRRRRGGRGRKSGERQGEGRRAAPPDDKSGSDDLDFGEEFDDISASETDEDVDDAEAPDDRYADEESTDGVQTKESSRSKASQRTIPSWEDAIGFIVDSNMQSQSQRRPQSRGNSSRGRARGRRRN